MSKLILWEIVLALLVSGSVVGEQPPSKEIPDSLIVVSGAMSLRRSNDGYWFSEGCERMKYSVAESYPGTKTLGAIFSALQSRGWSRSNRPSWRFLVSWMTRSVGRWEGWEVYRGGRAYGRTEQWHNEAGDLVSYYFEYAPYSKELQVTGRFCPAPIVRKYQCKSKKAETTDGKSYAINLRITKIDAVGANFNVYVTVRNDGTEAALLPLGGELSDGSPELWVLGLEQQQESGDWEGVGAVCAEHPAMDFIVLKPDDQVESWATAVDFPEPNHWFAMCSRKVGHLSKGKLRASLRYFKDPCEVENPLESPVYRSISPAVDLPAKPLKN